MSKKQKSFCVCRRGEYGVMINCYFCPDDEWYHAKCMGLPPKGINNLRNVWKCPKCVTLDGGETFKDEVILKSLTDNFKMPQEDQDWNPWLVKQVHPSDLLVDKFQSWDNTGAKPRLKAWHRAQKWVSDIIRLPFTPPTGHALKISDKDNAFLYLTEVISTGVSFNEFLKSCMIPPKLASVSDSMATPTQTTSDGTSTEDPENVDTTIPEKAATATNNETTRAGKICKSTWLGTECQLNDCERVHIKPCQDRECRALDDGLPLYKRRKCPLWHVRSKSKKSDKYPPLKAQNGHAHKKHQGSKTSGRLKYKPFQNAQSSQKRDNHGSVKPDQKLYRKPYFEVAAKNLTPNFAHKSQSKATGPMPANTWLTSTSHIPTNQGNEPAAAGIPLNRGGFRNQSWGHQTIQSQKQLITEICIQVMKSLPGMNTWH